VIRAQLFCAQAFATIARDPQTPLPQFATSDILMSTTSRCSYTCHCTKNKFQAKIGLRAPHVLVMDEIRQSSDVNDAATRYLEGLIRKHLRAVRYKESTPPLTPQMRQLMMPFMLEILIDGLEQDKDIVLAHLLKAAIWVRQGAIGDEAAVVDEFLQQFLGNSAETAFLQSVLEDLMRREELDEDEWEDEDELEIDESGNDVSLKSDCWPIGDGITVSIGNDSMLVAFEDILACFWTSQLDTTCHTCNKPSAGEPPIRTIGKGDEPHAASTIHVRVYNRHFSCIQNSSVFVPVSHVWDNSIRTANKHRVHNNAAASKLVDTLEALFEGSENAYKAGIEFWHDYFSVPQWHAELKDALLLRLPAIYHSADEILVHMADVPSPYVSLLLIGGVAGGSDDSVLQAIEKIPLLRAVFSSRWMERMWVALEYVQCRAACVMDKYNHIWRFADDNIQGALIVDIFARDTFSRLVENAHMQVIGLFAYAQTFAKSLSFPGEFLGGMAAKGHGAATATESRQLCLGEAIEIIVNKKCEFPRDRLFAVHILLNGRNTTWPTTDTTRIPQSEAEACAWVWREALTRGDYSPFLLQPRERVTGSNSAAQSGFASWLVGYAGLEGVEWVCGNQLSPPLRPPAVDEVAIHADLDLVGRIEKIYYLDVENSGQVAGVDWAIGILGMIARANGDVLSAERVVDGLNRVFPFDIMHERMARLVVNMSFSFEEHQERDREFRNRIGMLLTCYSKTPNDDIGRRDRQRVAQQISDILGLEVNISGNLSSGVTRLTRSKYIAGRRRDRGAHNGEPICGVKCLGCGRVTLFRLDLRDTANVGQRVYRIPGLSYSESVKDGVGLVIDEGRITGRMLYGPPACDCRLSKTVKVD
jgi:hypothetical protein